MYSVLDNRNHQQTSSKARGSSCNHCRRRKLKCDGKRPICDVCRLSTLPLDDCEYAGTGQSQAHILQEKISILETRIGELQASGSSRPSVSLHDPYSQYRGGPANVGVPLPMSRTSRDFRTETPERRRVLLDTFLSSAAEVGFFMNPIQFTSCFVNGNPNEPLVNATLLLVAYMSKEEQREAEYFSLTKESLASNFQRLSPHNPLAVISAVQAYVLLTNYLFLKGKILEGRYYANTALSLVFSTGLHRPQHQDATGTRMPPRSDLRLPPARDVFEQGERINAVWAVFSLNSAWTAAEGSGKSEAIAWDSPNWRVNIPWPLEVEQYGSGSYSNYLYSNNTDTIQCFLENVQEDHAYSMPALYSKACIVFEKSTTLYHQYRPNLSPAEASQFKASYETVSAVLNRFITNLRDLEPPRSKGRAKRMFVVYLLTRVALIQLLYTRGARYRSQILSVLDSIVGYLRSSRLGDFGLIDPLVAPLLRVVGNVLLEHLRASPTKDLAVAFDTTVHAMMTLKGTTGSMMETQASILRDKRVNVINGS